MSIRYGDVQAVRELSFTAQAGEITCVVGRNGAGKTSTIEALEGLRRPAAGRLAVLGLDPVRDHRTLVERMGVMLQDGGLHPAVKVREVLSHGAALYPDPRAVPDLLERVGLHGRERRTVRSLSGGEQKRLALALALIGRPDVAFLDEPTSGVDPEGRVALRGLVSELRDEGVTVLLSSHELDEVERMADRVVMIDGGRLLAHGTVKELVTSSGGGAVTFRADPGIDVAALADRVGAPVTELTAGEYRVDHPAVEVGSTQEPTNPEKVVAITGWLAEQGVRLRDLRVGHRTLEEVFLAKVSQPGPHGEPQGGEVAR